MADNGNENAAEGLVVGLFGLVKHVVQGVGQLFNVPNKLITGASDGIANLGLMGIMGIGLAAIANPAILGANAISIGGMTLGGAAIGMGGLPVIAVAALVVGAAILAASIFRGLGKGVNDLTFNKA